MRTSTTQRTVVLTLFLSALLSGLPPSAFAAQTRPASPSQTRPPAPEAAPAPVFDDQNAQQTRERLREVLNQYPPSVAQVLRLDPSLIGRSDYLATYPALAAFLAQHPTVAHNPSFFLGDPRYGGSREFSGPETDRSAAIRMMSNTFGEVLFLIGFVSVVTLIAWLARSVIDYRAWLRASKVQTEAHTKVVDRLTSNEDLLAYVQSPVGQRFLASTSIATDFSTRSVGSPVGRILWSVQIGVVLALGGVGLFIAKNNVVEEAVQPLYVVAVLAIALGIGFVLSALVAYALSRQLGLLEPHAPSTHA
jgi:hypothetical protein